MKNKIIIFVLVLGGFLFFHSVFANTLYIQPDKNTCLTILANTTFPLASTSVWVANESGILSNITMASDYGQNFCGSQSNFGYWLIYDSNDNLIYTSQTQNNEYWRDSGTGAVSSTLSIVAGQGYKIVWHTETGNGNSNSWYADFISPSSQYVFNVKLSGNGGLLALNFPNNLDTLTDFQSFYLPYSVGSWQSFQGRNVQVCYGIDQNLVNNCSATSTNIWENQFPFRPLIYVDGEESDSSDFSQNTSTTGAFWVHKTQLLLSADWYAKGVLYGVNSNWSLTKLADTPEIGFHITVGPVNQNYYASTTATGLWDAFGNIPSTTLSWASTTQELITSSMFNVDCSVYNDVPFFSSGTFAAIGCNVRKSIMEILGWLFLPSQSVENYLINSWQGINNAFPFSIIFGTLNSVADTAQTQAHEPVNDIVVNLEPTPDLHFHWVMLSSTTLDQSMGTSTKAKVFEAMTYAGHLLLIVLMAIIIL